MHTCISSLLLCNKLLQNPAVLHYSGHLSSHSFAGTQAPTWWFWLRFQQGCRQAVSQGSAHLKVQLGLAGTFPLSLTGSWRPQLLTGCWEEASVLSHMGDSVGLLTAQQLASTKPSDPRENKK